MSMAADNAVQNPKIKGGIHPPLRKNTAEMETVVMPVPEKVTISMSQHLGAPCTPTVKVGDEVFVGTKVGDSDKFLSVPIFSSVSGKVSAIKKMQLPRRSVVECVEITSDGEMKLDPELKPPVITNTDEFIAAIKQSGLVGLGGAGFPTWIKLSLKDKQVDTLIINAVECEPYITSDYRQIIENTDDVINGILAVKKYINIPNVIIAVKDDKVKAISLLKDRLSKLPENESQGISVKPMRSIYPLGAEKILIYLLTGRQLTTTPPQIPADVGCVVMNISSVSNVSEYLRTGIPLIKRRITIDGSAIANPQNVMVPIGTSMKELLEFTGGFKVPPGKIISGGMMTGATMDHTDVPTMKSDNAILALSIKDSYYSPEMNCIRCGRCINACPMNLMPTILEDHYKANNADKLAKGGAMTCMECSSCSYVCPSHRPLLHTMKLAKDVVRAASSK